MSKYRTGFVLTTRWSLAVTAALLVALAVAPSVVFAESNLHFIGAKRTANAHEYSFYGYYDYDDTTVGVAERIIMSVRGTYYPASVQAREVMTFKGSEGTETVRTLWDCARDPWLDRHVSCNQPRPAQTNDFRSWAFYYYGNGLCGDTHYTRASLSHWCFASRKLVPAAIASLMRYGPPPPQVTGPTQVLSAKAPRLTLRYRSGVANRYWIQQWYCPLGKDGTPTNTPGDLAPFGGACKSSVKGPLALSPGASSRLFPMSYPKAIPDAGIWYVRARLDSKTYGLSTWGHWHRTVANAPMHFKDTFNPPLILQPTENQHFVMQQVHLTIKPRVNVGDCSHDVWWYDAQWQRAKLVEPSNVPDPGVRIFKMRLPWKGYAQPYKIGACKLPKTFFLTYQYDELRSHDVHYGYRYWVRLRLHDYTTGRTTAWTPWRSFVVQEPHQVAVPPPIHTLKPTTGTGHTLRRIRPWVMPPVNAPQQH